MKTRITLKSFADLPPEAVEIRDASPPTDPVSAAQSDDAAREDSREMLHRRHTTSYVSAIPHRWGLNE